MFCAKFGCTWPRGFKEEVKFIKPPPPLSHNLTKMNNKGIVHLENYE